MKRTDEYTMFQKSKPWGYHPDSVEERITKYETALSEMNTRYLQEVQANSQLIEKMKKLQEELREMHLQMSSLEVPNMEEAIEGYVMNSFKNYNSPEANKFPEPSISNHEVPLNQPIKIKVPKEKDKIGEDEGEGEDENHILELDSSNDPNDKEVEFKIVQ